MRTAGVLPALITVIACSDAKAPAPDANDHETLDAARPDDGAEPEQADGSDDGGNASPTADGGAPSDAAQLDTASDAGRLPPGPPVEVTPEGKGALQFHGSDVCLIDANGDIQCRNLAPVWKVYRKGPFKAMALDSLQGCGIAPDDSVACWTDRVAFLGLCPGAVTSCVGEGQPPAEKFAQVSVFNKTACGVTLDGRLLCWGEND